MKRSNRTPRALAAVGVMMMATALPAVAQAGDTVRVASGAVAGTRTAAGIRLFRGLPYAAPPVGALRWREPRPVAAWAGVRSAAQFGPRCMQPPIFADMVFRSSGMSEDCLYLNVWTPARSSAEKLPVLVYFYGGGFIAGDGSEPRYDGESMARRGIVAVTVNYRLGVFGLLAHPQLTAESPHHASGNEGMLDQAAALRWVRENIAAFGGDPARVTIGGESAGSISVSALMASPLSRGLIAGAIGESGAQLGPTSPAVPLSYGEQVGTRFATAAGVASLAELRALSSQEILDAAMRFGPWSFHAVQDGYFFPRAPGEIYAAGEQARVPLLAGWNTAESNAGGVLGNDPATPEGYAAAVRRLYGDRAADVLRLYPGATPEQAMQSAGELAGDRFLGLSTWKWLELQARTGARPVYRYLYARPRPAVRADAAGTPGAPTGPPATGAVHSAEIEYALGNLDRNRVFAWTADDRAVSATMQAYFANFIKTGDPNGAGLATWPALRPDAPRVMRLDVTSAAEADRTRARYELLDQLFAAAPWR